MVQLKPDECRVLGVLVENVATTDKTLPGFVDLWRRTLEGS